MLADDVPGGFGLTTALAFRKGRGRNAHPLIRPDEIPLDADGVPIPNYTLADCPGFFGDALERVVTWNIGSDVSQLSGQPVRLRFVLQDADLYSMRFQ